MWESSRLLLVSLLGCFTLTAACGNEDRTSPSTSGSGDVTDTESGDITGTALLAGESDHSGIIVFVAGASYAAYTDAAGHFIIQNVPVGTHEVTAARWGFATTSLGDVTVAAGVATNAGSTLTDPLILAA